MLRCEACWLSCHRACCLASLDWLCAQETSRLMSEPGATRPSSTCPLLSRARFMEVVKSRWTGRISCPIPFLSSVKARWQAGRRGSHEL